MKKKNEDAPTNSTGPAVPGTGSDVAHWKKKKKKKIVSDVTKKYKDKKDSTWESVEAPVDVPKKEPKIEPDTTFASMPVFKVDGKDFAKCRFGKTKFSRWSKHIDTKSKIGLKIYNYAKKNPNKSIIVQHQDSGHILYLRKYKSSAGNKSGIMVKKGDKE